MGLFRTLLLVVLSCAVMSVQAANFNQPKAVASTDVEPFFNVSINEGFYPIFTDGLKTM